MGKLSDIIGGNSDFFNNWNDVKAADDFGALPPGTYVCHISKGEVAESRIKQTPHYRLTFRVIEGEFIGRLLWHEIWLTEAAKPQARRDFDKFGWTDENTVRMRVKESFPPGCVRCRVKAVVHKDDSGNEHNDVKSFEVIGIDTPKADPFAPSGSTGGDSQAGSLSHGGPAT